MLRKIFGDKIFSFPKSLYATHDTIRFFVANKPNALILDFFAGSGTTLHAVNLLNAEDGGNRRCIMVTNNEVSDEEAKEFQKKGLRPGEQEWESKGIARYVTWPRTVCSIKGENIKGEALKGDYLGGDKDNPRKMSDGFKANAAFFKLGFLNPGAVALGRKFEELLPVLWMKAGAHGECPKYSPTDNERGHIVWPQNKMAILFDEGSFARFAKEVRDTPQVETSFVVTDYEPSYRAVVEAFPKHQVFSLYSDYLTSFRVNVKRG
jgi:adenine-specific DNA-methyltransferase